MRYLLVKILSLLFVFVPVSFGAGARIEVRLERTNKLGIQQNDHLVISDKTVFYNNKTLKSEKALKLARAIQGFKSTGVATGCAAGVYHLSIKSGKESSEIKGCAEGKAYGELLQKLYDLLELTKGASDAP